VGRPAQATLSKWYRHSLVLEERGGASATVDEPMTTGGQ
jgi:hypothetical protein